MPYVHLGAVCKAAFITSKHVLVVTDGGVARIHHLVLPLPHLIEVDQDAGVALDEVSKLLEGREQWHLELVVALGSYRRGEDSRVNSVDTCQLYIKHSYHGGNVLV